MTPPHTLLSHSSLSGTAALPLQGNRLPAPFVLVGASVDGPGSGYRTTASRPSDAIPACDFEPTTKDMNTLGVLPMTVCNLKASEDLYVVNHMSDNNYTYLVRIIYSPTVGRIDQFTRRDAD
jgi:hypothetical protein